MIHMIEYFISFFFSIFISLLFTSYIIIYAIVDHQRRKAARERILRKHLKMSSISQVPDNYYPIRYSNDYRFNSFLKIFPWSGAGWIIIERNGCTFLSEHNYDVIIKKFNKTRTEIIWTGIKFIKNGGVSWFTIIDEGRKYHFTGETGFLIFGSEKNTIEIFQKISGFQ